MSEAKIKESTDKNVVKREAQIRKTTTKWQKFQSLICNLINIYYDWIFFRVIRSHYGPGVDSDSAFNRNEYQEHFLGVKAAGA